MEATNLEEICVKTVPVSCISSNKKEACLVKKYGNTLSQYLL